MLKISLFYDPQLNYPILHTLVFNTTESCCTLRSFNIFQRFMAAMGPPGGGRNDITSRLTRHMNVLGVNEFDDSTMLRIFSAVIDAHFSKGFEPQFQRLGKVSRTLSCVSHHAKWWIVSLLCDQDHSHVTACNIDGNNETTFADRF